MYPESESLENQIRNKISDLCDNLFGYLTKSIRRLFFPKSNKYNNFFKKANGSITFNTTFIPMLASMFAVCFSPKNLKSIGNHNHQFFYSLVFFHFIYIAFHFAFGYIFVAAVLSIAVFSDVNFLRQYEQYFQSEAILRFLSIIIVCFILSEKILPKIPILKALSVIILFPANYIIRAISNESFSGFPTTYSSCLLPFSAAVFVIAKTYLIDIDKVYLVSGNEKRLKTYEFVKNGFLVAVSFLSVVIINNINYSFINYNGEDIEFNPTSVNVFACEIFNHNIGLLLGALLVLLLTQPSTTGNFFLWNCVILALVPRVKITQDVTGEKAAYFDAELSLLIAIGDRIVNCKQSFIKALSLLSLLIFCLIYLNNSKYIDILGGLLQNDDYMGPILNILSTQSRQDLI